MDDSSPSAELPVTCDEREIVLSCLDEFVALFSGVLSDALLFHYVTARESAKGD